MQDLTAQDRLLDLIYAMPFDINLWPRIVAGLTALTGAKGGVLQSPQIVSGSSLFEFYDFYNFDAEDLRYGAENYGHEDPFSRPMLAQIGGDYSQVAHAFGALKDPGLLKGNGFWHDHLHRMQAGDVMALILQEPKDTAWPVISLLKARDGEAFSSEEIGRLQSLSYHLRFATRLRRKILMQGGIAPGVKAIFDFLPTPCALLNSGGAVLSVNEAMDAHLQSDRTCAILLRHFTARNKATDDLLQHAIRLSTWGDIRGVRRGSSVTLTTEVGTKRVAVVTPIGDQAVLFGAVSDICAAIYIVSEASGTSRHDRLRSLLGLTQQEALIAGDLIAGLSPQEIAQSRQRSVATIRTQINAILKRNNFRRVGDLLAMQRLFDLSIDP